MYTLAYILIKQRLKAIAEVKTVDWYLGQDKGKGKLLNTPAVFVEFEPSETTQQGRGIQKSEIKMNIHLVTDNIKINDTRVKNDTSTDHLAILESIFATLNSKGGLLSHIGGHEGKAGMADDVTLFNSLSRNGITPPHDLTRQMKSVQQFTGLFFDYSSTKNYTRHVANLVISE